MLKLTIVVDNLVGYNSLLGMKAEHGFAMLLEIDGQKILYDAGESELVMSNLSILGVHPKMIDSVVVSHGHSDHTGGLSFIFNNAQKTMPVFAHPDIFLNKVSKHEDGLHFIGIRQRKEAFDLSGVKWHFLKEPYEIAPNLWLSGEVVQETLFEKGDTRLSVKYQQNGQEVIVKDGFKDDLSLFFKSAKGLLVITGCAHSGIINIIKHGLKVTGATKLYGVIGGIHLKTAGKEQIKETIAELKRFKPSLLINGHCTGPEVQAEMLQIFTEKVVQISHVGLQITI